VSAPPAGPTGVGAEQVGRGGATRFRRRSAIALLPAEVRPYEPLRALDGGPDGLVLIRRIVAVAARLLRLGGWLVIEVGGDQDEALLPTLATSGNATVTPWCDDDGDLRGIAARLDPARPGGRHGT
jgi:release factor glutamine methyltransferase